MSPVETFLPCVLAATLLLVSISIFGALPHGTVATFRGAAVSPRAWMFPMTILAVGPCYCAPKKRAIQNVIAAIIAAIGIVSTHAQTI